RVPGRDLIPPREREGVRFEEPSEREAARCAYRDADDDGTERLEQDDARHTTLPCTEGNPHREILRTKRHHAANDAENPQGADGKADEGKCRGEHDVEPTHLFTAPHDRPERLDGR